MKNHHVLAIAIAIVVASVIVGGSIYITEKNKSESIERQQAFEYQQKKDEQDRLTQKIKDESQKRSNCATESANLAVEANKEACTRGAYCIPGEDMYSKTQYQNIYTTCLQKNGLQ